MSTFSLTELESFFLLFIALVVNNGLSSAGPIGQPDL